MCNVAHFYCRVYERMKADYEASNAAAQEEERLINLLREEQEVGWTGSVFMHSLTAYSGAALKEIRSAD